MAHAFVGGVGIGKVAVEHQTDLAGLANEFFPKRLAVVVSAYVVGLRVDVVAERDATAVFIYVGMSDQDHFGARICGHDGLRPSESDVAGIELEHEKKILHTVNREDAVEVFVASERKLAL